MKIKMISKRWLACSFHNIARRQDWIIASQEWKKLQKLSRLLFGSNCSYVQAGGYATRSWELLWEMVSGDMEAVQLTLGFEKQKHGWVKPPIKTDPCEHCSSWSFSAHGACKYLTISELETIGQSNNQLEISVQFARLLPTKYYVSSKMVKGYHGDLTPRWILSSGKSQVFNWIQTAVDKRKRSMSIIVKENSKIHGCL